MTGDRYYVLLQDFNHELPYGIEDMVTGYVTEFEWADLDLVHEIAEQLNAGTRPPSFLRWT